MAPLAVVLGQDVEEEGLHVIVERLVVQEELGQEAQVLAVDLARHAVHLEDGEVVLAVDLVRRRVVPEALGTVPLENAPTLHVLETELTDAQLGEHGVLLRVRGREPGLDLVLPELDHGWGADGGVEGELPVQRGGHGGQGLLLGLLEEGQVALLHARGEGRGHFFFHPVEHAAVKVGVVFDQHLLLAPSRTFDGAIV